MHIESAIFLESNTDFKKCPTPNLPEFAFIGRSNVGKSSLINMITGHKKIAKTSSTPGKTQTLNHFLLNKKYYIADLPGYGYAKTSKTNRRKWEKMIRDYLFFRPNLMNTFILVDSRHNAQASDLEFMEWMGENSLPFSIIFTKTDKLSTNALREAIPKYLEELSKTWEELPVYFLTSAEKSTGRDEVLDYIEKVSVVFVPQ